MFADDQSVYTPQFRGKKCYFVGNILLNVMLNSQMPFSRQGKNNVTFMCVPNPALDPKDTDDPKPSSILLRVKTGDDADELLENINKHKGE